MRIAIDAQLTVGTATGIGEYVTGLVGALRARDIEVIALLDAKLDPWRFDRRVFWDQVLLPQRARQSGAHILHCASGTIPLSTHIPIVVTVHDVAGLRAQAHPRPYARYYYGRFALDRYRAARAIVVDSEFSRAELLDVIEVLDPSCVHVVYPGVANDFAALTRAPQNRRTILVVGTVERRKNLELIIRTLPFLDEAKVIVVGPYTPYQDECVRLAEDLEVDERVEFRGYIPRDELLKLYAECTVLAMPSRYEGFGYGAAQALCAGIPCVAADVSSLPEILGQDARVLSIDHIAPWVEALESALQGNDNQRAQNIRESAINRFSWKHSADKMIAVYTAVNEPMRML